MEKNTAKVAFAKILSDKINPGMSECESYGMAYGCDEYCPVYQEGLCEIYFPEEEESKYGFQKVK